MKFKLLRDNDDEEKIVYVKDKQTSPVDDLISHHIAELLRKALNKDEKKDEHHHKHKIFSRAEMTCWTILLCAGAPWIGLFMLKAYAFALSGYAQALPTFAK